MIKEVVMRCEKCNEVLNEENRERHCLYCAAPMCEICGQRFSLLVGEEAACVFWTCQTICETALHRELVDALETSRLMRLVQNDRRKKRNENENTDAEEANNE